MNTLVIEVQITLRRVITTVGRYVVSGLDSMSLDTKVCMKVLS
jgi:hypothetical protein